MDELALLEADSIEAYQAAESASIRIPAPDFTGSLEYIDSLASRASLTLSRRDAVAITTAIADNFHYLSPLLRSQAVPSPADAGFSVSTDFRPLGDARRFDPEFSVRAPRALNRSSARVVASRVSPRIRNDFPPGWRNPLDPSRETDDLNRAMRSIERRISRKPFQFKRPNQVVICLKRKIRRQVMNALGFAGGTGFRVPHRTYWSKVVC